jgi:hypothetical protein
MTAHLGCGKHEGRGGTAGIHERSQRIRTSVTAESRAFSSRMLSRSASRHSTVTLAAAPRFMSPSHSTLMACTQRRRVAALNATRTNLRIRGTPATDRISRFGREVLSDYGLCGGRGELHAAGRSRRIVVAAEIRPGVAGARSPASATFACGSRSTKIQLLPSGGAFIGIRS